MRSPDVRAVVESDLGEHLAHVPLDGSHGEVKAGGDRLIRKTCGD
jgi:hypothetical protein